MKEQIEDYVELTAGIGNHHAMEIANDYNVSYDATCDNSHDVIMRIVKDMPLDEASQICVTLRAVYHTSSEEN